MLHQRQEAQAVSQDGSSGTHALRPILLFCDSSIGCCATFAFCAFVSVRICMYWGVAQMSYGLGSMPTSKQTLPTSISFEWLPLGVVQTPYSVS